MPSTNPRLMHFTASAACAIAGNPAAPAASGAPAIRRKAVRLVIICLDIDFLRLLRDSIRELLMLRIPGRSPASDPLQGFVECDAEQHDSEQRPKQGNGGNFHPRVIDH